MKTKRAVVLGAGYGLVVGFVMFLVSLSLRHHEGSILMTPYRTLNTPALWVLLRLHGLFYDWETFAGYSQVLASFLIYWAVLGTVVGLGWRAFWNRKHQAGAA